MKPNPILGPATAAFVALLLPNQAISADLIVDVSGAPSQSGQIGCALHSQAEGFPMDNSRATQSWHAVSNNGATCTFTGLTAGTYAVAVSHDTNANKKTDTNLVGIPTEAWGVSNNVRPRLRAPRFDEAGFAVPATGTFKIKIAIK